MDLFATWLPPAAIIAVILFANNQTNKRINDLRDQMKNDHANLAKQMELGDQRLSEKIDSVQGGLEALRQDFKLLRQDFIRHLEFHIDSDKKEK